MACLSARRLLPSNSAMKLIEKDAKQLLSAQGILIPKGFFLSFGATEWPTEQAWFGPCYVKSQVLAGRRGKGGLVRRCASLEEFNQILNELYAMLSADQCAGFWCEEEVVHTEEWFVACDINPTAGTIRFHVSSEGGKEVAMVQTIEESALSDTKQFPQGIIDLLHTLGTSLRALDAISIELNPCILNADGVALALDAKIELDEAASFRHPEWKDFSPLSRFGAVASSREQEYLNILLKLDRPLLGAYVELTGNIGVILAGGGASLVAMDALKRAGGSAANYLEASGNPDPDFLREASKIVFLHPNLKAIWIAGSFANFTDIQATVRAILQAVEELGLHVPIFIRRDGPNADEAEREANEWAARYGVPLTFQRGSVDLSDSAAALVQALSL